MICVGSRFSFTYDDVYCLVFTVASGEPVQIPFASDLNVAHSLKPLTLTRRRFKPCGAAGGRVRLRGVGEAGDPGDEHTPLLALPGVPALQHQPVPRAEEDHALDALDARQHLRQRRPLRAAVSVHVQSPPAGSEFAGSGEAENRNAVLLQRRDQRLLHGR